MAYKEEKLQAINECLWELGDSSEVVAESLRVKGIRGVLKSDCDCPVSRYLKINFPGTHFSVGRDKDIVNEEIQRVLDDSLVPGLNPIGTVKTWNIYYFVRDFGNGKYPDLIDLATIG